MKKTASQLKDRRFAIVYWHRSVRHAWTYYAKTGRGNGPQDPANKVRHFNCDLSCSSRVEFFKSLDPIFEKKNFRNLFSKNNKSSLSRRDSKPRGELFATNIFASIKAKI